MVFGLEISDRLAMAVAGTVIGAAVLVAPIPRVNTPEVQPKTALVAVNTSYKSPLENLVSKLPVPQFKRSFLRNLGGYLDKRYHQHDKDIIEAVDLVNSRLSDRVEDYQPLDPLLVKSMLLQETGAPHDTEAFNRDPMQIANDGDDALDALQSSDIYSRLGLEDLAKDFKRFETIKFVDGRRDYSQSSGIDARSSIFGGTIFLAYKALSFGERTVNSGEPSTYVVQVGDSLWKIAQAQETTQQTLRDSNKLTTDKIMPGDELVVQPARFEIFLDTLDWEHGVKAYNGGGTDGYAKNVLSRLSKD